MGSLLFALGCACIVKAVHPWIVEKMQESQTFAATAVGVCCILVSITLFGF
jgi:ABC-type sulfate transport system permease component